MLREEGRGSRSTRKSERRGRPPKRPGRVTAFPSAAALLRPHCQPTSRTARAASAVCRLPAPAAPAPGEGPFGTWSGQAKATEPRDGGSARYCCLMSPHRPSTAANTQAMATA